MSKEKIFIFLTFACICLFSYRHCFAVFIPADNYGLLSLFEMKKFIASMSHEFHYSAPYLIGIPLHYFLFRLFGTVPAYWIATAIFLHVLNACLVFMITEKIVETFFNGQAKLIAFFTALCFLISPYQTENVLWVAVIRWLFQSTVMLAAFYLFILYLADSSLKKIIAIQVLFLLALFSYEHTVIFPLIFFIVYLLYKTLNKTSVSLKSFFIQITFFQLAFVSGYFISCKIYTDHWLWHAGSIYNTLQPSLYIKVLLKYFAKFFLFYRYLPLKNFDTQIRSISVYFVWPSFFFLLAIILYFFIRFIKKKTTEGYFILALFSCFLVSLLPVLPLDSSFLKYIYPDRYGYLPSVFFYLFLIPLLFFLLRKFALYVIICYAALCWILLMKTIPVWILTNNYCNRLIENYKPFLKYDNVYVLDVPAYYNGTAAFRSAFASAVFFKYNYSEEKIRFISGSYHDSVADSLTSATIQGNEIKITGHFRTSPYFSTNGGWAKSYETIEYKVNFDPTGCAYTLSFKKEIPLNSVFIYAAGNNWKKAY